MLCLISAMLRAGKGSDPCPMLSTHEVTPGVLGLVLLGTKGTWTDCTKSTEGHQEKQRTEVSLL